MTFYHFWPILEALIITPKRRLAEKQQEECGVLRWSDLFEVREEVLKLKERDKRLIGKGAEKLQRYNQQDK